MEQPTPTFGSEFPNKKGIRYHFSDLCNISPYKKKRRKLLLKNTDVCEGKHKRKKSKIKKGNSHKKTKAKSPKLRLKNKIEIFGEKKNGYLNYHLKTINSFIRNHRFELRDDFNEKNVNNFLSSKEVAFEIPILLKKDFLLDY